MTEFTQRYKELSDIELLQILAEPERYQPLAIETAKKEMENRQLSEEKLHQLASEIQAEQHKVQKKTEKKKQREEEIKAAVSVFSNALNPIQIGIQTSEKIIGSITIIFTGFWLYKIAKEFEMIVFLFMFPDSGVKWDLHLVEYFLPLLLLPIALFLFWKRKKIGWILLSVFITYSAMSVIGLFFLKAFVFTSGIVLSEPGFQTLSYITYFINLLFFGGTLYIICSKDSREIYRITEKTMWITIGFTIIANAAYLYSVIG